MQSLDGDGAARETGRAPQGNGVREQSQGRLTVDKGDREGGLASGFSSRKSLPVTVEGAVSWRGWACLAQVQRAKGRRGAETAGVDSREGFCCKAWTGRAVRSHVVRETPGSRWVGTVGTAGRWAVAATAWPRKPQSWSV